MSEKTPGGKTPGEKTSSETEATPLDPNASQLSSRPQDDAQDGGEDTSRRYETFALTLFRLFKLSTMHTLDNQAVQRGIKYAETTLRELMSKELGDMSALFSGENIFINGQPLRASRGTYEAVIELGEMLNRVGLNEIRLGRKISADDLQQMLEFFLAARRQAPGDGPFPITNNVRLQFIDPSFLLGSEEEELTVQDQIARTVSSTVVVMRRALEAIEAGEYRLVNTIKRAAQSMVMLAEQDAGALLGTLEQRPDHGDRAMLSVQTATLASVMTRLLTRDMQTLSDVTSAALLFDVGELRLLAQAKIEDDPFGDAIAAHLTDRDRDRSPASAAAALVVMTGLYDRSIRRSMITHEATWLCRQQRLGLPYHGKLPPSLESIVVAVARRFLELIAFDISAKDSQGGGDPDVALQKMLETMTMPAERLVLKLMCSVLGLYPRGTLVELTSGWRGVISGNHTTPSLYDRPQIFLVERVGKGAAPKFVNLAELREEILGLGTIARILPRSEGALAQAQEMLLNGQLEAPTLLPPKLLGDEALPQTPADGEPRPGVASLTDQGSRRLQSILDSSESARRVFASGAGEDDDLLFSTHDA